MRMETLRINVTTGTDGTGATTSSSGIFGYLHAVQWIDGTFADGVDGTFTCVSTNSAVSQTFLTLTDANTDAWYYPRQPVHDAAGAVETYNSTEGVTTLGILDGYPALTIAQGGNTATGGAILYYEPFNR